MRRSIPLACLLVAVWSPQTRGQCQLVKLTGDPTYREHWGAAVALGDGFVSIGLPLDDEFDGSVRVFSTSGARWLPEAVLLRPLGADPIDDFGRSVAVDGSRLAVGAPAVSNPDTIEGGIYILERDPAGNWSAPTLVLADEFDDETNLEFFGYGLALDGDRLIGGAYNNSTAYIFERQSDGEWPQVARLSPSRGGWYFGFAVALEGDTAVVGAPNDADLSNYAGAAFVFERDAASGDWIETTKLLPHDGSSFWSFGESVAISGDRILAGAKGAYVGDVRRGAAYVFERQADGGWLETAKLSSDEVGTSHWFGESVALQDDVALITAENANDYRGAAYVFQHQPDSAWLQHARLIANDGDYGDRFGESAAMHGDTAVIGAHYAEVQGVQEAGAAYVFSLGLDPDAPDCDGNGVPDACDPDCDLDGLPDACDVGFGVRDCNGNGRPDQCELFEADCNDNRIPDDCDVAGGASDDCDADGVPDECEADCNGNGVNDACDIRDGDSMDCNDNGVPDECPGEPDCNGNALPDDCDIADGFSADCNGNGSPDECDLAGGDSDDCDADGVPDECQSDCNGNGVNDACDIRDGDSMDCNGNGVPDECDVAERVLWDQTEVLDNQSVWEQEVGNFPAYSSYVANDVVVDPAGWRITRVASAYYGFNQLWFPGQARLNIFAKTGDLPESARDPRNGELVDYELDEISFYVFLTVSDLEAVLLPGEYWVGLTFSQDFGTWGTPDRLAATPRIGAFSAWRNPGGDFGYGRDWIPVHEFTEEDAWMELDAAVRIEGHRGDCNANGVPDSCDIADGTSSDCDGTGIPDECKPDCNGNGVPDGCDIADGTSSDCDSNGVPDECEPDCNGNGIVDACDIDSGHSLDCNRNGIPDACDFDDGTSADCNANGVPDECDIEGGKSADCNGNAVPDACDIAAGDSPDCNANGAPDECDLAGGKSADCNDNGVPDECDIAAGDSRDCNANGVPDSCDLAGGGSADCNDNAIPDECETDCNANGVPDECDAGPFNGYALLFGSGDGIDVGSGAGLNLTEGLTVEAWVRADSIGGITRVVSNRIGVSAGYGFGQNAGRLRFSAVEQVDTAGVYVERDRWTHVAVVFDLSHVAHFYVDGRPVEAVQASGAALPATEPMQIGRNPNGTNYWPGKLDEVRIWDVARSDAEILATYDQRLGGDEPGLVGYWPLDEGDGTTVNDAAGGDDDGVFVGEPAWVLTSVDADGDGVLDECECPGDLDGDGEVGLDDLSTLLTHFGGPGGPADGDIDGDGDVDLTDLSTLLDHFGRVCA